MGTLHSPFSHRATLRDVAREAGVSLKTASNAANGTGRMSPATRAKVKSVISDLDYHVNLSARNLNSGLTHRIVFLLPILNAPYLSELADSVIQAAVRHNYSIGIETYSFERPEYEHLIDRMHHFNTSAGDGMLLSLPENIDVTPADLSVSYPLAVVGSRQTYHLADHVTTDDVADARMAVTYLHSHGAQHIAVIGAHSDFDEQALLSACEGNAELRLRGVIEEERAQGMHVDPQLIPTIGYKWNIGEGYRATQALLSSGARFDAILALNDQMGIGAVAALNAAHIAIPGAVQVIGFDNNRESEYMQPPLSSVDSQIPWIAQTAVNRIIGRIQGSVRGAGKVIMRRSRLILRGTTRT
jgi:LacI family repressor for deo operon, udp, cdd, tsx, nupC, and nupG